MLITFSCVNSSCAIPNRLACTYFNVNNVAMGSHIGVDSHGVALYILIPTCCSVGPMQASGPESLAPLTQEGLIQNSVLSPPSTHILYIVCMCMFGVQVLKSYKQTVLSSFPAPPPHTPISPDSLGRRLPVCGLYSSGNLIPRPNFSFHLIPLVREIGSGNIRRLMSVYIWHNTHKFSD